MKPMTSVLAVEITASFGILKFFPRTEEARLEIADLLRDMCPSAEAGIWLRERVLAKWSEWEGPGPLRELLSERFKPADEKRRVSEYDSGPPLHYELVTDRNGNEGVRLLDGAAPLSLAPAAETETVSGEFGALVKAALGSVRRIPIRTRIDGAPLPPDPRCTRCLGTGWLLENELRCECTHRQRADPIATPNYAELEREYRASCPGTGMRQPAKSAAERELEAADKAPLRTAQQRAAEEAALEAELVKRGYNPPHRDGRHREVTLGTEKFLVQ